MNGILGKFLSRTLAFGFSERTVEMSAVVLGDDGRFWVVTMAALNRLTCAGYELAR